MESNTVSTIWKDGMQTAAAWLEETDIEISDEDKALARRYLIKRNAKDLIGMLGL